MVFSNDKTKHVLVHKSKGKDRLLSEKQRTGNQTLCLALARTYGLGQVTRLPRAVPQWAEYSRK